MGRHNQSAATANAGPAPDPAGTSTDTGCSEGATHRWSPDGRAGSLLPLVIELVTSAGGEAAGWRIEPESGPDAIWIHVYHERREAPSQGWKLHVSAALPFAAAVLQGAAPCLIAEQVAFKVVCSGERLTFLNDGHAGLSQIGKFLTVYPRDDAQAVRLAAALDAHTDGLRGPRVPSDRVLRRGSLVHYRYGGFSMRQTQSSFGVLVAAIRSPDGEMVEDPRVAGYRVPEWAVDPFVAAGLAPEPDADRSLVGGRYLIVSTLYRSARGAVYLAIDVLNARRCVLKRAGRDATMAADGLDARDRLRNEAELLRLLAPDLRFPDVFDLFENGEDLFLAMEEVEGQTLAAHVGEQARWARFPAAAQVVAWGRELAAMLGALHARGIVYRDLKSANVIVAPGGSLRLVDFELAEHITSLAPRTARGTRGYVSPQQGTGHSATESDDIYSLGALLYFAGTIAEPSFAPRPLSLGERPATLLNPALGAPLEGIIARCLHPDPARRFPTMAALDRALAGLDGGSAAVPPQFGAWPEETAREPIWEEFLRGSLSEALCRAIASTEGGGGSVVRDQSLLAQTMQPRSLYHGESGVLLALAGLVEALDTPREREVLGSGAHRLAASLPPDEVRLPGLYTGEAGAGVALLRAGQALGRPALIDAARALGRWVAAQPHDTPDLIAGLAGRARFHLLLSEETGSRDDLASAIVCGDTLLAGAEEGGDGDLRWRIPPGFDELSGRVYLGYAHGAAGIGDVLLDLFEATGAERFRAAAGRAARFLAGQTLSVLEDGSGSDWPEFENGPRLVGACWCHGAAGVGRFFLRGARLDLLPEAEPLALRAAWSVARGPRWLGPGQCHGLAGNIEFLLDVYQVTQNPAYLVEARSLARLLEPFAAQANNRSGSSSAEIPTPGYMLGAAGIAICFLRLLAPQSRPHILSRGALGPSPRPA